MGIDQTQITILMRVLIAFVIGVLIGFDRERSNKPAGIRTQMLVCVGSSLLASISLYLNDYYQHPSADPARLMAQIVSGIGFLGAGVILKNGGNKVTGVTTAATIWITAAIGIAIGVGFYASAVFTMLLVLLLNPMAIWQYKIGLKGDLYELGVKRGDRAKTSKILAQLSIKIRAVRQKGQRVYLVIFSSEQRNHDLMERLNKAKVEYYLEEIENGE